MKCKHLIGITGYAGSGKGAAADILKGMGFKRIKFAGPLKAGLRAILQEQFLDDEMIERMIEGDLKEVSRVELGGRSPREFMQWMGTEARHVFGADIWVNMAINAVLNSGCENIVIDDVRFENEAAAIRGLGGVIVEMHRDGVGPINDHPSEAVLEGDATCINDGTLADMREDMEELVTHMIARRLEMKGLKV